jgi:hypothetical protein
MKKIHIGHVPQAPISPNAIHRAHSQLIEHKAHATRYLAMSPKCKMSRYTAFLKKYYLLGARVLGSCNLVVVLVLVLMMMMYILGLARFDEN